MYAVVFTYSFDTDAACYLHTDLDDAKKHLREAYETELKEQEANECLSCDGYIDEDGLYASIATAGRDGIEDLMYIHLATVYN